MGTDGTARTGPEASPTTGIVSLQPALVQEARRCGGPPAYMVCCCWCVCCYSLSLAASDPVCSSVPLRIAVLLPAGEGKPSLALTIGSISGFECFPAAALCRRHREQVVHERVVCDVQDRAFFALVPSVPGLPVIGCIRGWWFGRSGCQFEDDRFGAGADVAFTSE